MIFSVENGFGENTGYNAAGLNRTNSRFRQFMEPLRNDINGARILDIASHDGRWSYAALKLGATHITGIEARADLIESGKHRFQLPEFAGRYKFIAGDIFDVMPELLKNGQQFDVVLCLGIFYHIMDHYRLLRLMGSLGPRLIILDTGLIDDDRPHIFLTTERNDNVLNAIPVLDGERNSIVGLVSRGGLMLMCRTLGFTAEFLNWNIANFKNRDGLNDYFQTARDGRRRYSVLLRRI